MDSYDPERPDDSTIAETPEDVAVLYSWANLHGAKYRDFSASRREYRAQLRHRAAQQARDQALLTHAEAEAAAQAVENAERQAVIAVEKHLSSHTDPSVQRSLREAEAVARTATAERVEVARRAEAIAVAQAAARREEREIAEAHASAQRQAARYAESEMRRRTSGTTAANDSQLPAKVSDPYRSTYQSEPAIQRQATVEDWVHSNGASPSADEWPSVGSASPVELVHVQQPAPRRQRGYRPDDASGVRQIYRGPDYNLSTTEQSTIETLHSHHPASRTAFPVFSAMKSTSDQDLPAQLSSSPGEDVAFPSAGERRPEDQTQRNGRPLQADLSSSPSSVRLESWPAADDGMPQSSQDGNAPEVGRFEADPLAASLRSNGSPLSGGSGPRTVSPFSQALVPPDSTRGRRAQDDFDYQQSQGFPERARRSGAESPGDIVNPGQRTSIVGDPAGPAWLYAPPAMSAPPRPANFQTISPSSVADTLQHSRERVAARWFALKGVFQQPGHEQTEATPVRQKETRTPVLAVFSLAGGVGKTSLVATVGRSLSSLGEKVLLTDTTSHGLLPFYFGASELREGTVRTFSPPSGSTDAPIYLVSYDVERTAKDDTAAQELLAEEIVNNSRGTHRVLLDLNPSTSWIVRRLFRLNPTILVPVAPDMNSVISLQAVEKFFHSINDGDGRPLQPFYLLNQFDTSLPLHLDVREVLRRQLGERLLPFVIRRAPSVSEALAEGMTVVDYAPDAPIAEDFLNVANWLRTIAAPATAGFRNVRWSER